MSEIVEKLYTQFADKIIQYNKKDLDDAYNYLSIDYYDTGFKRKVTDKDNYLTPFKQFLFAIMNDKIRANELNISLNSTQKK